ncbi:hypothetical protein [Streptomyces griseus]|uniref:hypothetical protein n=1 Tax=Streptomyces griseus TaxID=1911 RepID=UPI00056CDADB|nr:hypothetical protein [Streptomyces griseus]
MRSTAKVWLPSAVWVVAAAASPWAARALARGDLTALPLLVVFVVVGVLGFPLGVGLGRLGARREATAVAALSAAATTATCAVQSYGTGFRWTPGGLAFLFLVALIVVVTVLPLPGLGFVIGWAVRKQRR